MKDLNIVFNTFKFAKAHMNKLLLQIKKRKDTPNRTPTEQCKKTVICNKKQQRKQTRYRMDKI